jgi:uncharacterized membrane protein YdbT with pleckstrin-like domain
LSTVSGGHESDIIWKGHPSVSPTFVGATIAAILVGIVLTWFEIDFSTAFVPIASFPMLATTYLVILLLWLASAANLSVVRASSTYILRRNSLEIHRGILGKKIYTMSAAGFSDLEVRKSVGGRILNMGDIMIESDSGRDLTLRRIRDPMKVSSMVRGVMATPMVRIAREEPVAIEEKAEQKAAQG